MTEDKQNIGALLTSLGARRVGVDHYTEHDFEMERIGRDQSAVTYDERLKVLEDAGWVPFRCPFYYANREFHAGHFPPGTKKHVPTTAAFAMFLDANPEVELPKYKPHPHGWKAPVGTMPFKTELISVEPMKMPQGLLLYLDYTYGDGKTNDDQKRWRAFCDQFEGVRSTGIGSTREKGEYREAVFVTLEHDGDADKFPEEWEDRLVVVKIKPEAEERTEKEAKDKAANERYQEEAGWLRKGSKY